MTGKIIMIASSKGGVGKSTVALGITAALAKRGHKVLIVDLDFGNACLDMLLGVQDSVICTVQDVAAYRSSCDKALIKLKIAPSKSKKKTRVTGVPAGEVWLLPSSSGGVDCIPSYGGEDIFFDKEAVTDAIKNARDHVGADYVIIDTGAGVNAAVSAAASIADEAFIVTGQMPVALRSAEATASRLSEIGVKNIRLIINSFDADGVIDRSRKGVISVVDSSRAPLFGVIPYDYRLMLSHERLVRGGADSELAFSNIARRIEGENISLFSGMKKLRKLKNKICL